METGNFLPKLEGGGGNEQDEKEKQFEVWMGKSITEVREDLMNTEAATGKKMSLVEKQEALDRVGYIKSFKEAVRKSGVKIGSPEWSKLVEELRIWSGYQEKKPGVEITPKPINDSDLVDHPEETKEVPREEISQRELIQDSDQQIQKELDRIIRSIGPGPNRDALVRDLISRKGSSVGNDVYNNLVGALGGSEVRQQERLKIPTEPTEYKRFIRQRVREIIRKTENENDLSFNSIERTLKSELVSEMGFDPSRGGVGLELYPKELGTRLAETKNEIELEIKARVNLRGLQIKENKYKDYGDKNAALASYIRDMKGAEGGGANPSVVATETYRWLKTVDSLNDLEGATTEKIDKAFLILLALGETKSVFSNPDVADFARFRAGEKNIYDPEYDPNMKEEALNLIAQKYGEDARDLAYQLFQAYKEEGNYNKKHYLFVLYKFSEARKDAAKINVFIGSRRLYIAGQEEPGGDNNTNKTHKDEIDHLALSPLRVEAKIGVDPNGKDITRTDVYFERALGGRFLQETELVNPSWVKNTPEMKAFSGIKAGDKARAAIIGIGTLGMESDKSGAVSKAESYLSDLRRNGQELVASKVISQAELDEQMFSEAKNVLFELSIDNPINIDDLSTQSRDKVKFLLASKLPNLLVIFGKIVAAPSFRIINNNGDFSYLRNKVESLRRRTFDEFEKGSNRGGITYSPDDEKLVEREKNSLKVLALPSIPGEGLERRTTNIPLKVVQRVTSPVDRIRKALGFKKNLF